MLGKRIVIEPPPKVLRSVEEKQTSLQESPLWPFRERLGEAAKVFKKLQSVADGQMGSGDLPDTVYLVSAPWYAKFKSYALIDNVQEATPEHLIDEHPGKITNLALLKPFHKYVRSDVGGMGPGGGATTTSAREDLVCRKRIVAGRDYVLLTRALWEFLAGCFGADFAVSRERDGSAKSGGKGAELQHEQYAIHHEDNLKLLILPPVDQITEDSLAEIGKPIKAYYNSKTTF